jgi:tetratricopeptide (TPR) repeat protein
LQRPQELLLATVQWVRSFEEPDPELDQACADMQAQAAAIELLPRERLRVHGAQARAARVRGDSEALLAHHRAEVTLARQIGWLEMMQAAESNVCHVLNEQGRHEEAAEQGLALLAGIDAVDDDQNANLPWVFNSLIEALTALGRLDEAQALVPRATVAGRRADLPSLWVGLAALAVAQRRWRVAAGLIGHVRQHSAAVLYDEDTSRLEALEAMVVVALGQGPAQALVMRGRMLNQEGAASLACAS